MEGGTERRERRDGRKGKEKKAGKEGGNSVLAIFKNWFP